MNNRRRRFKVGLNYQSFKYKDFRYVECIDRTILNYDMNIFFWLHFDSQLKRTNILDAFAFAVEAVVDQMLNVVFGCHVHCCSPIVAVQA